MYDIILLQIYKEATYEKNIIKTEIDVKNNKIGIMRIGDVVYISLTNQAKYSNSDNPANIIIIGWAIKKLDILQNK